MDTIYKKYEDRYLDCIRVYARLNDESGEFEYYEDPEHKVPLDPMSVYQQAKEFKLQVYEEDGSGTITRGIQTAFFKSPDRGVFAAFGNEVMMQFPRLKVRHNISGYDIWQMFKDDYDGNNVSWQEVVDAWNMDNMLYFQDVYNEEWFVRDLDADARTISLQRRDDPSPTTYTVSAP